MNNYFLLIYMFYRPLRPSLPQQRTAMKDDADIEDAAYDIRPALVPAEDILVCSRIKHLQLE